jgi:hypothetical protein
MNRSTIALWFAAAAVFLGVFPALAQNSASPPASAAVAAPAASAQPAATTKPTAGAKAAASAAPVTSAAPAATTTAATPPATPAAPGTTGTSGSAAASTGAPGAIDGSTYVVRLRDLEQRVDELKEQVRRSHTRLSLLSDTILSGGVGGARADIVFKNELSNAFHLTGATFVLDGAVQYNKQDDTGSLAEQKEIPIFSGSVPPGDHTLQVVLKLRGHGYGVFSYLRGYKFNVPATHSFTVTEGKAIRLEAVVWEKGDVTTPLEERPAIRWQQTLSNFGGGGNESPESVAPAGRTGASGGISIGAGAK